MDQSDRFFAATVFGGRLHVRDIPDWGPWDSSRIEYFTESYVDPGLVGAAGDRKVRTREELEAAIKEPMKVAPTRNVWIHESLEGLVLGESRPRQGGERGSLKDDLR